MEQNMKQPPTPHKTWQSYIIKMYSGKQSTKWTEVHFHLSICLQCILNGRAHHAFLTALLFWLLLLLSLLQYVFPSLDKQHKHWLMRQPYPSRETIAVPHASKKWHSLFVTWSVYSHNYLLQVVKAVLQYLHLYRSSSSFFLRSKTKILNAVCLQDRQIRVFMSHLTKVLSVSLFVSCISPPTVKGQLPSPPFSYS